MAAIYFMTSISILVGSSNEIDGTRIITGVKAPSFSVGINDFPRKGNKANDVPSKTTATKMVIFSRANPLQRRHPQWCEFLPSWYLRNALVDDGRSPPPQSNPP